MRTVNLEEAIAVWQWLNRRELRFVIRTDEASALTNAQILAQCGIHVAALRLVDRQNSTRERNEIEYRTW